MPWYKQGTVSVTLNSNAVTGTGTSFIANSRVGDAFRGPDGRWYEVTNAPSDTSLSIDPPYQGATASGGSYALAPMQGYVKDSADALRSLVNTYGAKLAALGTTGNYDTLPVSKGGTGGTDQATARTGLGLGSAATAVVQTSSSDATAGRLLAVGAFGWNGGTCIALPVTDVRTITTPGEYALGAGGTNLPNNSQAWYLRVVRHTTLILHELRGMTAVNAGQVWTCVYTGSAWEAWSPRARGGANSDITSLTGLTTALSVAQGGTGGNSQATARTGLGLGSAATANVGTAAGNVMAVGAGGWLGASTIDNGNANNAKTTGLYSLSNATNAPYTAVQLLSSDWGGDARWQSQLALGISQNKAYFRSIMKDQSAATTWAEIYHTGNTTRAADGTLKAI